MPRFLALFAAMFAALTLCAQQSPQSLIERVRNLTNGPQPELALPAADSAYAAAIEARDTLFMIKALRLKGKALSNLHRDKDAADLYFQALRWCRMPQNGNEAALIYGEIGYMYFSQNQFRQAKNYYEKELTIRRALKGEDSIGNQLLNLAVMSQQLEEFDSALADLNELAGILAHVNDSQLTGYYYLNRGAVLEMLKLPDSAACYYHNAYDIWKNLGNESQIYKVTFNLGFLAEEKKDFRRALDYYKLSEASAKKYGLQREIGHVYGTMAEAYAGAGDYKNAYDYLYRYAMISDSLSKDDLDNYIARLDKQFQTEKNKTTIREQELRLKAAELNAQQQRNRTLIIVLVLVALTAGAVIVAGYLTFRSRVKRQVEDAKTRFFDDVVHEIRTPLSMIQGPVLELKAKVTDTALRHQLDIAERNTRRLNDLVGQMLDISKIESARYQLQESVGNPTLLLDEVFSQYESRAVAKKLIFTYETEPHAGNFLFDRDALEKIAGNLLENAFKYTPENGSAGAIARVVADNGAPALFIRVWDSGPGIAKKDQPHIFDRFFRAGDTAKKAGMGIGLSLVKDLVLLMGGSISVDSEPGSGAVFTATIPLKQHLSVPHPAVPEMDDFVLLAEDDDDILDFNKILLTNAGYNVATARNGRDAMELMAQQMPALVITDLMMPVMDGLALLREIRANPLTDHIPVIILSAKASALSRIEGVAEGAQVYLPKPFQPAELLALVRNQLDILKKQALRYQAPAQEPDTTVSARLQLSEPFTKRCYDCIAAHIDDPQLSVEKLAELMNVNRSHFQRKIKATTGFSPSELIRMVRLEKAHDLLARHEGNVTEVAYATGFSSQSYFTKCFSEHYGYPPSQAAGK